jgi:hypothetical protein
MSNENEINPSTEAELVDQGFSKSDLGDQGYSAAGEVGLIKARRSLRANVWRGLKSAPPTALFGLTRYSNCLTLRGERNSCSAPISWGGIFCRA